MCHSAARSLAWRFFAVVLGFSILNPLYTQTLKFVDVTTALNVPGNTEGEPPRSCYGHGVIMTDLNGDNRPDIYISNAMRYADHLAETLYISTPGGGYKENDAGRHVSDDYGWTGSHGICFVDYDNDGDYDLYNATTDDRNRLYQNDGSGYFADVTDAAALPLYRFVFPDFDSEPYGYGTRGLVAFDANNDGYMDLFGVNWGPAETRYDQNKKIIVPPQPNEFYLNNGDGTFSTVTTSGLTHPENPSYMGSQGVTAADVDNDGDMDVLIVHRNYTSITEDSTDISDFNPEFAVPNQLLINDGHGHFTDETEQRGLYDAKNDANGATFADFDNDGDLDLFVPPKDEKRIYVRVYKNDGRGYFTDITTELKIEQCGFSTFFLDADNDTDLDIIVTRTRSRPAYYQNEGNGTYRLISNMGIEVNTEDPRGGAIGDIDDDGDLDIYIADANKNRYQIYSNHLFRNDLKSSNRWLKITGRGPGGDMGGFGTKIWLYERGSMDDPNHLLGYREVINAYGYLCQDDPVQHFGLGLRDSVDVKVQLLDGTTLRMNAAPAKQRLFFTRPQRVSVSSGNYQSGAGFSILPQPLKVQVHDQFGNIVYGGKVTFSSSDPAGQFFPGPEIYTDKHGYALVRYQTGGDASQTITAECDNEPDFAAVFSVTTTGSTPPEIVLLSGDQQSAAPGERLAQPLCVKIVRQNGTPFQNYAVTFRLVQGDATFESDPQVFTNSQGVAAVDVRLGKMPGTIIIYAEAASVIHSPIQFTAYARADVELIKISGDQQSGQVGAPLSQEMVVRAQYGSGGLVANLPILFSVMSGDGNIDGSASKTVLSDAAGLARVTWTLGTVTGLQTLTASVEATAVEFSAMATAGPAVRLEKASGDGQTLVPGQPFAQPFGVRVLDRFANPVPTHRVVFRVSAGNGSIDGSAETSLLSDQQGLARVVWTPDPYLGPVNILKAESNGDGIPLDNSPVEWSFPGVAVDAAMSVVTATGPVPADGQSTSTILVSLRNAQNQLVGAGLTVAINVSGSGNSLVLSNDKTDVNGQVAATLSSSVAEEKIVTVFIKGLELELLSHPLIDFQPSQHPTTMRILSGNNQQVRPNTNAPQALAVLITDGSDRPVADYPVRYKVSVGDMRLNGATDITVQTDSNGMAQVSASSGAQQGPCLIEARTDFAFVYFTLMITDGLPDPDVKLSTLTATTPVWPDGLSSSEVVATIVDESGRPIQGIKVGIQVAGEGVRLVQPDSLTNANGQITARLTSTVAGAKVLSASVLPSGVTLEHTATVLFERGTPGLEALSGQAQDGIVGQKSLLPLVVLIKNGDKPVANHAVRFSVDSGGGHFDGQDTLLVTSDANGLVSIFYHLGITAGVNSVRASLPMAPDKSVTFRIIGHADVAAKIIKQSGDEQTGAANTVLAEELVVFVTDVYDNPVAGTEVTFSALDGGAIVPPATVHTDSAGRAAATARLGQQPGAYRFKAALPTGAFVQFNAVAAQANSAPQVISYLPIDNEIAFDYNDRLSFEITQVFDADNDVILYSWYVNDKLVGNQQKLFLYMSPILGPAPVLRCDVSDGRAGTTVQWSLKLKTSVALSAFRADVVKNAGVLLSWSTTLQSDILGFRIVRAESKDGRYNDITGDMIKPCAGGAGDYQVMDPQAALPGTFYYKLECVSRSGHTEQFGPVLVNVLPPDRMALLPNYPNPFNPTTTFAFELSRAAFARLIIYNQNGQVVRELVEEDMPAGHHTVVWDARDAGGHVVPTGIYLYRLTAGEFCDTKKMTLLK